MHVRVSLPSELALTPAGTMDYFDTMRQMLQSRFSLIYLQEWADNPAFKGPIPRIDGMVKHPRVLVILHRYARLSISLRIFNMIHVDYYTLELAVTILPCGRTPFTNRTAGTV